jgi:hypothetical protein
VLLFEQDFETAKVNPKKKVTRKWKARSRAKAKLRGKKPRGLGARRSPIPARW